MRRHLTTDALTGLLFLALGSFVIVYGSRYPLGSASRMGPSFFPLLVSSGLVLLGIVLVVRSIVGSGQAVGEFHWRPVLFVLGGTLLFALLLERAGFVLAAVGLVMAARLADRGFRLLEVSVLAVLLVAFVAALFWLGLSLPLRPFAF